MSEGETKAKGPAISRDDPSEVEVRDYVVRIVAEVDAELRSDRWVILSNSQSGMVRLYAGALLWHCCELLADIHTSMEHGREMAMRLLYRAFHEAWLMGLYVQYGGLEATMAIEADMKASFQAQLDDAVRYDRALKKERKRAAKVRKHNEKIAEWNREHPELPRGVTSRSSPSRNASPSTLLCPFSIVLSTSRLRSSVFPTSCRVLNELGESLDDGDEHFGIVYTMGYRTMSSIGAHPNLEVIQSYFDSTRVTNFVRLERRVRTPSTADLVNQLTLQQVADLSFRVLGDIPGAAIPVTEEILARYLAVE